MSERRNLFDQELHGKPSIGVTDPLIFEPTKELLTFYERADAVSFNGVKLGQIHFIPGFHLYSLEYAVAYVPLFLWNDSPGTRSLERRTVARLQAVPISDNELNRAKSHGTKALEDIFMKEQIDVYNIERSSVL